MNGKLKDPSAKQFLTCIILGSRKSLPSVSTPSAVFHLTLLTRVCDRHGFLSRYSRYSDCSFEYRLADDVRHVVLQCAIPVFEGIFPPTHDSSIKTLLFRLCEWHALAKLRTHTDESLVLLQQSSQHLGNQLRRFKRHTCAAFSTHELPKEAVQWQRREIAEHAAGHQKKEPRSASLPKTFNLDIYKFHALGDYVDMIKTFSTTDSYTIHVVSRLRISLRLRAPELIGTI